MSITVGTVKELWRYPVKSMVGQTTSTATITESGMLGDRGWIVRDDTINENVVVRTLPKLLLFAAEYLQEPVGNAIPNVRITFPDGTQADSSAADINNKLSAALGKSVSLWPLQSSRNWRHYRLSGVMGSKEMKRMFASKELPDFSSISWKLLTELMIFSTPLGRYHDVYPLHVVTTGALSKMKELEPGADFGPHRFRPNLVIESNEGVVDFDDFSWIGGKLSIGSNVVIQCESRTVRCSMPAQPQFNCAKDSSVLRSINSHTQRHFGINASVLKQGQIKVGDEVRWEPGNDSALSKKLDGVSGYLKNKVSHSLLNAVDLIVKK